MHIYAKSLRFELQYFGQVPHNNETEHLSLITSSLIIFADAESQIMCLIILMFQSYLEILNINSGL